MRGTGRVGTDREGALEKSKWGAGGLAKVSFKAKWALDRAQMLIYTHTQTRRATLLSPCIKTKAREFRVRNPRSRGAEPCSGPCSDRNVIHQIRLFTPPGLSKIASCTVTFCYVSIASAGDEFWDTAPLLGNMLLFL